MLSRRMFLGGSAAMLGLAACGETTVSKGGVPIDQIGLQTYTLREIFEPDPVGTLKMLKELGYDYVELNDRNFATRSAKDLTAMIKDAGLYAPATHYGIDGIRDNFDKAVRDAKALEVEYIIIPWISDTERSLEDYKRHAAMFNERGQQARDAGFKFAYHNHQFEFDDLGGGTTGMDILLGETDPDIVDFELDIFWVLLAGQNISELLRAHSGRFKLCHIKDMKGDPAAWRASRDYGDIGKALMVNVGEGTVPFENYLSVAKENGVDYFIVEHDSPPKPFRESVKGSLETVRGYHL